MRQDSCRSSAPRPGHLDLVIPHTTAFRNRMVSTNQRVRGGVSPTPPQAHGEVAERLARSKMSSTMSTELEIEYLWIPHALGGHRAEPYVGMRSTIRWQRYVREHLERSRDVECTRLTFDPVGQRGSAKVRLISNDPMPPEWLRDGNLIELLDGYKVIAVGRITSPHPLRAE